MEKLLAPEQVAEVLNVTTISLGQWHRAGKGPKALKLGNKTIRYRESDVKVWLKLKESK